MITTTFGAFDGGRTGSGQSAIESWYVSRTSPRKAGLGCGKDEGGGRSITAPTVCDPVSRRR